MKPTVNDILQGCEYMQKYFGCANCECHNTVHCLKTNPSNISNIEKYIAGIDERKGR